MGKWIVYTSTNIGNKERNRYGDKAHAYAFDVFEDAKNKAREILSSFAYGKPNEIFDGCGNLVNYLKLVDECFDPDENDEYIKHSHECMIKVNALFAAMFRGEEVNLSSHLGDDLFDFETNFLVAYDISADDNSIFIHGDDDGPFNGYDPHIYSNMFSMNEEKEYITVIDDYFDPSDGFLTVKIMKSEES